MVRKIWLASVLVMFGVAGMPLAQAGLLMSKPDEIERHRQRIRSLDLLENLLRKRIQGSPLLSKKQKEAFGSHAVFQEIVIDEVAAQALLREIDAVERDNQQTVLKLIIEEELLPL